MTLWEYATLVTDGPTVYYNTTGSTGVDGEATLNAAGAAGWEMCGFAFNNGSGVAMLKRPLST